MFAILGKTEYDSVIPCAEGGNNWRKKESSSYKANRDSSDIAHYADQSLLLEEVLPTLGMTVAKAPGFEADDVIAHIARHSPAFQEIHILTCDKDLLQCVSNKVKVLLFSSTKKMELVDIDGVVRHFGVFPSEVRYFKALAGDSSDNVAGIKGIGPKTAVKIIEESRPTEINPEFTGADRIVFHPKVRENGATFLANLRLVSLDMAIPDFRWFTNSPPSAQQVETLFEALEFKALLKRKQKIFNVLRCPATTQSLGG
jgi:DNA polymerase-1